MRRWFVVLWLLVAGGLCGGPCPGQGSDGFAATEEYYNTILGAGRPGEQANVAALNQFFSLMPKGGDIHHHYSGAIYAETFLDWVAEDGYWIHRETLKVETTRSAESMTVDQVRSDEALYRKLLSTWSDEDFDDHYHGEPPPDEQFFNTFGYFGALASRHIPEGLRKLKARAKQENVQYLETMLSAVHYVRSDPELDEKLLGFQGEKSERRTEAALAAFARKIDGDPAFAETVSGFIGKVARYHEGMDDDRFTMRFQTYVYRGSSPSVVFAGLYAGFLAASKSEALVGVNIVGPENGVVAIRDYWLHMQMFRWLRARFSQVHVAMHAGELKLGMVRPEDLRFHVTDAVRVAGAERIGHGVDIVHETDSPALLREMADKQIAVEINLTSNEFILGVSGSAHPVTLYFRHGVPLVISTDDPGVSRNDLANEYLLLATRYQFSYADIKKLVANSIRYSFLPAADREKAMVKLDEAYCRFEDQIAGVMRAAEGEGWGEGGTAD